MDIKKIIFDKLSALTKEKFTENSNVYKIGIDSLDLVELITDAEDELKISISDEELQKIQTVNDIIKIISSKLK